MEDFRLVTSVGDMGTTSVIDFSRGAGSRGCRSWRCSRVWRRGSSPFGQRDREYCSARHHRNTLHKALNANFENHEDLQSPLQKHVLQQAASTPFQLMKSAPDIIVIKGAPASGKSQTAKCLTRFFPNGVKIEVDNVRQMVVSVDGKNQAEHINLLHVSARLADEFLKLNFRPVIVVDTFSGDKIKNFMNVLKQLDASLRICVFSLHASDEVLKMRLESRPAGEFKDFGISKQLNEDVLKIKQEWEHLIDTTSLLPNQTAEIIYTNIASSE